MSRRNRIYKFNTNFRAAILMAEDALILNTIAAAAAALVQNESTIVEARDVSTRF